MPSEPFQVEFHIAGGAIVHFTLSEETLNHNLTQPSGPWPRKGGGRA